MNSTIRAIIGGQETPRERVLDWEKRRAIKVLKKLGVRYNQGELNMLRRRVMEKKSELGYEGMLGRLGAELAMSDRLSSLLAHLSLGARRFSVTELVSERGSAQRFVQWFEERAATNDEMSMIAGMPDHYVIRTNADGSQEVIETTGGSPMATRFYIDYTDISSLRSTPDPTYTHRLAGVARTFNSFPIGGVLHQFRDEGTGFRAKLTVEFPLLVYPMIVSGHRWHLAAEFSNWIEAAFGSGWYDQ